MNENIFYAIHPLIASGGQGSKADTLPEESSGEERPVPEEPSQPLIPKPSEKGAAPLKSQDDIAERLRKLEELKNEGLITETEYHNKRREILDQV